jgi:hypothetical protein
LKGRAQLNLEDSEEKTKRGRTGLGAPDGACRRLLRRTLPWPFPYGLPSRILLVQRRDGGMLLRPLARDPRLARPPIRYLYEWLSWSARAQYLSSEPDDR